MSSTLTPESALAACAAITARVPGVPNAFSLTQDQLLSVKSIHDDLAAAVEALRLSALDLKGKVAEKDATLKTAGGLLGYVTRTALNSNATDAELRTIGMARPAKPTRPTSIPAPANLVVNAQGQTQAKLAFDRNGAAYGATYEVFASPDGFAYEFLGSTTKASMLVEQTPGVAAWYKVRAVRAGLVSEFSNTASIYAPSDLARPALRVA